MQGGVGKDEEAMVAFKLKNEPVQNEREPMRSVIVGQPMYIYIIETLEEKFRRGRQRRQHLREHRSYIEHDTYMNPW